MTETKPAARLFVDAPLARGVAVEAAEAQAHYVLNVLRLKDGAAVGLFNGRDGEWRADLKVPAKRRAVFMVSQQLRAQTPEPDLWLAFAAVKRAPLDLIAEKATELGVSVLIPLLTARTNVERVNTDRLRANAAEAAQQCGRLTVPVVRDPVALDTLVGSWPPERRLFFLDETGGGAPIAAGLRAAAPAPVGFVIGPEGGFAQSELDALRQLPFATALDLGPRILRAETAALAALACWQALCGDWA